MTNMSKKSMFTTRKEIIDYLDNRPTLNMCAGIMLFWSPISNCVEKLEAYSTEYFVIEDILEMWENKKKELNIEYLTYIFFSNGAFTYKNMSDGWSDVMSKLSYDE